MHGNSVNFVKGDNIFQRGFKYSKYFCAGGGGGFRNSHNFHLQYVWSKLQQKPHSKFEDNSFSHSLSYSLDASNQTLKKNFFFILFAHFANCYKSHICASIWLKFGTCIESLKANTSIRFGVNVINIQGVESDFTHKSRSSFCHTYRINCFEEQAENRYVGSLNIRGVHFDG